MVIELFLAWIVLLSAFLHGIFWLDTRRKHQQWIYVAQRLRERQNTVRGRLRQRRR